MRENGAELEIKNGSMVLKVAQFANFSHCIASIAYLLYSTLYRCCLCRSYYQHVCRDGNFGQLTGSSF